MNIKKYKFLLLAAACCPVVAVADVSMDLEMACIGDIELSDAVINLIQGSVAPNSTLSEHETKQVMSILADDEVSGLDDSGKLKAVMGACSNGLIFQERNTDIRSSN